MRPNKRCISVNNQVTLSAILQKYVLVALNNGIYLLICSFSQHELMCKDCIVPLCLYAAFFQNIKLTDDRKNVR